MSQPSVAQRRDGAMGRTMSPVIVIAAILSAPSRIPVLAYDCEPLELKKVHSYNGGTSDQAGWAVALDGDLAAVGEIRDDFMLVNSGSVSLYRRVNDDWEFLNRVTSPGADVNGWFGFSVALQGEWLIVGAPFEDTADGEDAGSVHLFRYNGAAFSYEGTLIAPDGHADARFGYDVTISTYLGTTRIAIGANRDDEAALQSGAVYIYDYIIDTWTMTRKLAANDAALDDQYGWSVSMAGRFLAVGAPGNDNAGSATGSAYLYELIGTAWIRRATITADDMSAGANFGWDVAVSDDATVLVGAYQDNGVAADAGAAYVFRRNVASWPQEQKLTASDFQANAAFGQCVALRGDVAAIGAVFDFNLFPQQGSAYTFRFDGADWIEESKLIASDGFAGDQLGASIALDGDAILVGARSTDDFDQDAGAAYFFPATCAPPFGDMNCDGVVDVLDVGPFALALTDAGEYMTVYSSCDVMNGDANDDARVDGSDVSGFVSALLAN